MGVPVGRRTHPTLAITIAAQLSVVARLATLIGQRHKRGAMAGAMFCGKAIYGCKAQWVTHHQMKSLRGLIATSMGRTTESHTTGPFLLYFHDCQYEPDVCRTQRVALGQGGGHSRHSSPEDHPL